MRKLLGRFTKAEIMRGLEEILAGMEDGTVTPRETRRMRHNLSQFYTDDPAEAHRMLGGQTNQD